MMCLFIGARLLVGDDDLALAAHGAADFDNAVDLGDLRTVTYRGRGCVRANASVLCP
jgi:hypothetical protein